MCMLFLDHVNVPRCSPAGAAAPPEPAAAEVATAATAATAPPAGTQANLQLPTKRQVASGQMKKQNFKTISHNIKKNKKHQI